MSYFNIELALAKSIKDLNLPCPVGKFGIPLTDEEKGAGLWVQPHNMPASSLPATCGYHGEDEHKGVLQIDINFPIGQGSGKLLQMADQIRKRFQAGDTSEANGQVVKFVSCSLSPEMEFGGYQRRFLSVNYYARSVRHE